MWKGGISVSTTITIRLEEQEKILFKEYAKTHDMTISELIRTAMLERLEDEYDLAAYLEAIKDDNGIRYSHEDMMKEFGL